MTTPQQDSGDHGKQAMSLRYRRTLELLDTITSSTKTASPTVSSVSRFLAPLMVLAYAACGHRGKIRPSVPPDIGPRGKDFWYGLCVDAWYEDGWWEGVVFDNKVGSGERSIFFPDEGDELRFNVDRLRLTRDWNEASGTWTARGTWAFLALVNELTDGTTASAPLWIKQLWYNLRTTDGFLRRISEWTLGEPSLWRNLMKRAISDHHLVDSNNNVDKNAVAVVSTGEENLPKRRRVSRRRKPPFSAENVHEQHGRNCGYVGNVQQQVVIVEIDERGEEKQTPVGGIICSGEQEACPSSGHYEELEARSTVQPSPAFEQKNEVLDQEYGRQLMAEYIRLVDEKTKSKAAVTKGLLDRVRLEAKRYLLTKGWVFEHEQKCAKRELHYFSPEGKRFYSFYTACSALQREERPCPEKAKYQFVYKKGLRRSSVQSSHSATAVFTGRECIVVPSAGKRCAAHKEDTEASKSFVSCSSTKKREASISENKKDKDQSVQLCKKRVPTISKSPEFRTQPHSDVSAATSLANTKDTQQICFRSCPVPAEKPSNERLVFAGSNDERRLDNWKRKRGKHPKLLKMEAYGYPKRKVKSRRHQSDSICSVCHYGGLLILCDQCPSSFHLDCVNLKEPPKGKWFCPCCRCSICGSSDFSDGNGEFSELAVLYCDQCEREYHVGCWSKRARQRLESFPIGNWFCSRKCSKIFEHLHKILGKPNPTPVNGLSWTILRYANDPYKNGNSVSESMIEFQNKISIALDVLHECFLPVIEDLTGSDLVADVLFNRSSDLNRLNFRGFYTMFLEKGDELISVAVIRIHGEKVAEMLLIGTRVQYRRQGMCHLLMSELENMLSALRVEKLILPAASQLKDTWIRSFGFMELTSEEKFELLGFTFLDFQDTIMCQKLLSPFMKKNPQGITPGSCFHATKAYWQAQTGDRAFHPAGAYSVEATENCFQRKIPDESLMLIGATNIYAYSSTVEVLQEVSTDLGCLLGGINDKDHIDVNANRAMNLAKGWDGDFFQHIYTRRCRRIADESTKRMKQTALLCTIPHLHGS